MLLLQSWILTLLVFPSRVCVYVSDNARPSVKTVYDVALGCHSHTSSCTSTLPHILCSTYMPLVQCAGQFLRLLKSLPQNMVWLFPQSTCHISKWAVMSLGKTSLLKQPSEFETGSMLLYGNPPPHFMYPRGTLGSQHLPSPKGEYINWGWGGALSGGLDPHFPCVAPLVRAAELGSFFGGVGALTFHL